MGWTVKIGQGGSIRTQARVVDVRVTEEFAHQEFVVTIKNPSATDRAQAKGRVDAAIIEIKRGSDTLIEGFIEDIEKEGNTIKYIGRSFLVLTGYTTSSLTDGSSGVTKAEYTDKTGAFIIDDLMDEFCYPNDNELVYTDIIFKDDADVDIVYGGEVKLHGKKVYDIIRNMCIDYTKDLWADATWTGDNVTAKNIHVGSKSRGSVGAPNKTLYGGVHLKNIPTVKYRSSQNVINRIRVNGKGTGKDKVSIVVNDATSQTTYGVIEGAPYNNNMIVDEATAEAVGDAIIAAKKDLVEEIRVELIQYLSDLKYGDWVRIVDAYSFVDTTQRIKKITRSYNDQQGEAVAIEVGMPFDNYETLIKDLTKGDVDAEPEMTKLGGAFTITANDPPSSYVRHDKGDWYDTAGAFQTHGKGVCTFWTYADNPTTGTYKKALIQISNVGVVSYKVGSQESSAGAAEGTTVSADALNTPIGEIILKGKAVGGGGYTVEDVYSSDESGKSYIYRDVRPIVGSSSTGFGGDVSNPLTEDLAAGGFKITGLGAAVSYGDAISLDGDGYVPIAKLPLGGTGLKGGLLVGTETVCSSILPGTNTHVLTADDTEALGVKWAAAGAEGLWEIDGSETQLITADDIDMRARGFMHVLSLQPEYSGGITIFDSNGATKAYLGTTAYAFSANADINMGTSWKLKNLAAGAAAGDSIRYDEYSVHTHDGRYYTETEIGGWRNGTTQTEMGRVHGVTSDIQTQLNARMLLSVYDPGSDGVVIPTAGGTGQSAYAKGDILYASNTNVLSRRAHGTENQVLTMDATLVPVWAAPSGGGLWQDMGTYVQLIQDDHLSMRNKNITNLLNPVYSTDGANKQWVDAHNWAAADITSGTLPVSRGGTGVTGDTYDADKVDGCHAGSIGGSVWKLYNWSNWGGIYAWGGVGGMAYFEPSTDGYQLTTHGNNAFPSWSDISLLRDGSRAMSGALPMGGNKITGLAAGTVAGNALRYEQLIGVYLSLAGGTMNSEAGINMNDGSLTNVGGISMTNLETIDMNGGDIIDIDDLSFAGSSSLIDMNGGDISEVDVIGGTSGVPLKIEFKGDTTHRIYIDSTIPYYARYQTVTAHEFDIGAAAICYVSSVGITMAAGKYIKSTSGDLELRAPSGSKIKFVIG